MSSTREVLLLFPIFILGACGTGDTALGQVDVIRSCDPRDVACVEAPFDEPLAVGASLPLDFDAHVLGAGGVHLESIDPAIVSAEGRTLTAKSAGLVAILVADDRGMVLDFVHVRAEEPTGLSISKIDDRGHDVLGAKVQLLAGDDLSLVVEPRFEDQRLLGYAGVELDVEGSSVLLLDEGQPSERRLVARAAGTATITATGFGLSSNVVVEVLQ
jgi:hypothetical protein